MDDSNRVSVFLNWHMSIAPPIQRLAYLAPKISINRPISLYLAWPVPGSQFKETSVIDISFHSQTSRWLAFFHQP